MMAIGGVHFYEDDEPADEIRARFDRGPWGVTRNIVRNCLVAPACYRRVLTDEGWWVRPPGAPWKWLRGGGTVSDGVDHSTCCPSYGIRIEA